MVTIHHGDSLTILPTLPDNSFDSCVTDPPYELAFMGKKWDSTGIAYNVDLWREVLRVLKPGAHLLAFGGTRTYHRMACAIEDAGFEIRDSLHWLYGSGFPKSLDVSKAIDKAAGAEPIATGGYKRASIQRNGSGETWARGAFASHPEATKRVTITAPATPAAQEWQGWGTALKPSHEPVVWARKPLTTVPLDDTLLAGVQDLLGGVLCQLLLDASNVDALSASSPSASGEASVSALLLAAVLHGSKSAEWCDRMVTSSSPATASMCWNIASSWNNILVALCNWENRFTTSTATALTTALRTLNSCLLTFIPAAIIEAVSRPAGEKPPATTVGGGSCASSLGKPDSSASFAHALASLRQVLVCVGIAESSFTAAAQIANSVLLDVMRYIEQNTAPLTPSATSASHQPIVLARKPLSEPTIAANVLRWGTGALNVDGCRVGLQGEKPPSGSGNRDSWRRLEGRIDRQEWHGSGMSSSAGRWPPNTLFSHLPGCGDSCADGCAVAELGRQSGVRTSGGGQKNHKSNQWVTAGRQRIPHNTAIEYAPDTGTAARFFPCFKYCAKASTRERNAGLEGMEAKSAPNPNYGKGGFKRPTGEPEREIVPRANNHPTVKPVKLMEWLVRLVTRPGGVVLDPFAGSGTTGVACQREGFGCVLIEMEQASCEIARRRTTAETPIASS